MGVISMAVTLADVAKLAGVNSSTVSRVINGTARITPETRERVQAAMRELDYHPNSLARSLASGLSGAIGVVVDAGDSDAFSNVFFSRSLFAIEQVAQSRGYHVIIANGAENRGEKIKNLVKERKVDGLIVPPSTVKPSLLSAIGDFPYVVLGSPDSLHTDACWVDNDNEQGARLAVEHLLAKGYTKIAYLGGDIRRGFTKRRVKGYRLASGKNELFLATDGSAQQAEASALELLARADRPDAFLCNDNMAAFGLLRACKQLKLNIPGQIGVVAFDNYPLAEFTDPQLTVVDVDTALLGEQTAQLLFRRIDTGSAHQQITLSVSLIVRQSTERN